MTRLKLIALIAPIAFSTAAFAAGDATGSEYMHQTAAGKWEVTPDIEYHSWTTKFYQASGTTTDKVEATGMTYSVKGEYGINEMFSAGLVLAMTQEKWKTSVTSGTAPQDADANGLENVDIYGLGKYDLGGSMLRYGLDFALSTSKHKTDTTGTNNTYNQDLGGTNMGVFAGWESMMGPGLLGAKLSYTFQLTDYKFDNTRSSTAAQNASTDSVKGTSKTSLAVFYEYAMAPWTLGLSVAWNSFNGGKYTLVNGTSGTADMGHAGVLVSLYAPVQVADNITILPHVAFGDPGGQTIDLSQVTSQTGWDLGVGARFAF